MAFEYDDDKQLIMGKLTAEERSQIVQATQKLINDEQQRWQEEFGPFEFLSANEIGREELEKRLDSIGNEFIWSDVTHEDGHIITPVEGCVFNVTGWARVPGRKRADDYFISKKSSNFQHDFDAVFSYYNIYCEFCEGSGQLGDEDCDVCHGEGSWEVDAD
jgi:hypothetical protein